MLLSKELYAELSAIHAADALLQRSIQKETDLPLEEPPKLIIKQFTKSFNVTINMAGGFYFETFPIRGETPPRTKYITQITPEPWLGEKCYEVTALARATNEQIESELDSLLLPF